MKINKVLNKLKKLAQQDRALLLKILFTSLTRAISAFGTFVFNFVLAKVLGVDEFGTFMLMYTIIIGLGFLIRYGYANAIIRFGAILAEENRFVQLDQIRKKIFKLSLITSVVVGGLLIACSSLIAEHYLKISDTRIIVLFAFSLPFFSYLTVQSSYLKAFKKPQLAPFIEVGLSSFSTGVIVGIIALIGVSVDINLAGICFLVSSILIYFSGRLMIAKAIQNLKIKNNYVQETDDHSPFDFKEFDQSLFDYFLNAAINYLLKFSPVLILGIFATNRDVGLFSIANSTAFVINFILWIFSTVYAPDFAILYKNNELVKLRSMVRKSILYMSIIAIPVFLVIFCFPGMILSIFGKEYVEAKSGLMIMAVAQLINVLTGPAYFMMNMTGHQRNLRNIILITAILNVVSCLLLTPFLGYFGAVIGASIGLVFQNVLCFKHVEKILGNKLV